MATVTFIESHRIIARDDDDESEYFTRKNKCARFLTNRRNRMLALVLIFALVVPVLLYYFLIHVPGAAEGPKEHVCAFINEFRIPCSDGNISAPQCLKINCCFDYENETCFHYLPSKYYYLRSIEDSNIFNPNLATDLFGNSAWSTLKLTVQYLDEYRLKVILHTSNLYENVKFPNTFYDVRTYTATLGLDIFRVNGQMMLTTGLGPVIASDTYWEWSFYMGDKLFGLDQLYFTGNETYKKVIYKNKDDHTTLPAFMAYENGSYHGLLFEIVGPVEFLVLPSRLVSVRVLSGDEISFILTTGPTPKDVQQQLYRFDLPPRWLLEPHICRSGSDDIYSVMKEYTEFKKNNTEVRYATDCLHDNLYYLLYEANATVVQSILKTVDLLKEESRFIMTVYPQVLISNNTLYNMGTDLELFYINEINETTYSLYNGTHRNQQVAFIDYSLNTGILEPWFGEMLSLFDSLNSSGYSLKDNWPAEETFEMERVEDIPYLNKTFLGPMSYTIPWNITSPTQQLHYKIHNKYADPQVAMFREQFDEALIFSSSYNSHMNAIAQIQNMNASWVNLKRAIKTVLLHGLFASPFISIPVCGSTSEYNPILQDILCSRWYITAATMPMFNVDSDIPRRDHSSLPTGHSKNIALDALNKRKMFLPYFYTTLARHELIMRPMFYDFHDDEYTHVLDEQYMVGDALVVAQPLLRDMSQIIIYLPKKVGGYYEFFGGQRYSGDLNVTMSMVVQVDWIVFMREGKIIPLQNDDDTYTLAVALSLSSGEETASGTLFLNNSTLQISADNSTLYLSNLNEVREDLDCEGDTVDLPKIIRNVRIYGLDENNFSLSSFPEVHLCNTIGDQYDVDYFV